MEWYRKFSAKEPALVIGAVSEYVIVYLDVTFYPQMMLERL